MLKTRVGITLLGLVAALAARTPSSASEPARPRPAEAGDDLSDLQGLMRSDPDEAIRRLARFRDGRRDSALGGVRPETAVAAGRAGPELPQVDLSAEFTVLDRSGRQGSLYLNRKDPNAVVRVFDKIDGVTEADVRELARLGGRLRAGGVGVVPMEPVRTSDGRWGVRMPWVAGEPLGQALRALNDGGDLLTDPRALAMRKDALWTLQAIDAVTQRELGAPMAARGSPDGGDSDWSAFVAAPRGRDGYRLVDIDPIDMRLLRRRLAERLPGDPASLTASSLSAR